MMFTTCCSNAKLCHVSAELISVKSETGEFHIHLSTYCSVGWKWTRVTYTLNLKTHILHTHTHTSWV